MLYVSYISVKLEENFAYYNLTLTGTVFVFFFMRTVFQKAIEQNLTIYLLSATTT